MSSGPALDAATKLSVILGDAYPDGASWVGCDAAKMELTFMLGSVGAWHRVAITQVQLRALQDNGLIDEDFGVHLDGSDAKPSAQQLH